MIPCLNPDRTNWAMFCMGFEEAMDTTGHWGYFDSTEMCPVPVDKDNITGKEKEAIQRWTKGDKFAWLFLTQQLRKDMAMEVFVYKTAKEQWEAVKLEFMAKSKFARNNLKQEFFSMCCLRGGNIHAFLTSLRTKWNQIKAARVTVSNDNFEQTVLQSLPDELAKFAVSTQMSAHISGNTLNMTFLI
jgi:gag-polypeptide of LTR copia-type